ncbi:MAG: glycosyltransferase family 4 protein [Actinobacteria bacterium]|nr:glycosyltransferase family 4 protein [Actinomycetota bacterium]
MRILLWHVHGSWTTGFLQGSHEYLLPVLPDRGPDGRGRARTWEWPAAAVEVTPAELAHSDFDLVLLQRPRDLELTAAWTGRRPGVDVPAIYVEHNAPQGRIAEMRHPLADREDIVLAHVTHFNDLFWDAGTTPTRVIEHGIPDPGYRYTGELEEAAVAINEPLRRWRVTGTDLLPRLNHDVRLRVFGMGVERLGGIEDLPQERLHDEMARRRAYLHPIRWTSLGLSLIEAMQLGMPVVALATTEAIEAVPPEAGTISTRVDVLATALRELMADPERARQQGKEARRVACERFGLDRFLADWDELLAEVSG